MRSSATVDSSVLTSDTFWAKSFLSYAIRACNNSLWSLICYLSACSYILISNYLLRALTSSIYLINYAFFIWLSLNFSAMSLIWLIWVPICSNYSLSCPASSSFIAICSRSNPIYCSYCCIINLLSCSPPYEAPFSINSLFSSFSIIKRLSSPMYMTWRCISSHFARSFSN